MRHGNRWNQTAPCKGGRGLFLGSEPYRVAERWCATGSRQAVTGSPQLKYPKAGLHHTPSPLSPLTKKRLPCSGMRGPPYFWKSFPKLHFFQKRPYPLFNRISSACFPSSLIFLETVLPSLLSLSFHMRAPPPSREFSSPRRLTAS